MAASSTACRGVQGVEVSFGFRTNGLIFFSPTGSLRQNHELSIEMAPNTLAWQGCKDKYHHRYFKAPAASKQMTRAVS